MIERFKQLTEQDLPQRAKQEDWPIRNDHCFKRICLDNAFGDVWHHHLARPAQQHLQEPELSLAIAAAEQILCGGIQTLRSLNAKSLAWRGKSRTQKEGSGRGSSGPC